MVASLPENSIREAGRLLARAFVADPVITHFLGGRNRRRVAFPAFFRAIILENVDSGYVFGAWQQTHLVGVAVWTPPRAAPPTAAKRFGTLVDRAVVRALFPWRSSKLYSGFAATAPLHPKEPHWYLAFVGVEPNQQAKGIGRHLLAPVLALADQNRTVCYLETPFPATHDFYRRSGFLLKGEHRPFRDAPPIWTMMRQPVAVGSRQSAAHAA